MILQRLVERFRNEGGSASGYQRKAIEFVLVLDDCGRLVGVDDTRTGTGRAQRAREFDVPREVKRASQVASNLLWDNVTYVFGFVPIAKQAAAARDLSARGAACRECFIERIRRELGSVASDRGIAAVLRFLESAGPSSLVGDSHWDEIAVGKGYLSFRLADELGLVCERPAVRSAVLASSGSGVEASARCLVTGEVGSVARLHGSIKGVDGAQSSGASLISFNLRAFESYGKQQGSNAPVSRAAEFAYTSVLNRLLARDSRQKLRVGDATAVFWAEKPTPCEDWFRDLFDLAQSPERTESSVALRTLYLSPWTGVAPQEADLRFCVLGLSPNAARLAVRFWYDGTVREISENVGRHFQDLELESAEESHTPRPLRRLLRSIAVLGKDENVPPNLAGAIMSAILANTPYPRSLLEAAVRRSRAERQVGLDRASLIKAVLTRQARRNQRAEREVGVSLDPSNLNVGYRLGRLFAVLEQIQWYAQGDSNIRERYYGAASAHPAVVLPQLMKLKNHHLAKLDNRGLAVNLEKRIGEILDGIEDFPRRLALDDQGRFAVGYYHERTRAFSKKNDSPQE
ncbi:MAG: type I-C CRISPR-associated protein Cas8c/Csd1 [Candidatus Wallbacteria bacterium]|nr:type I-C CRISPR-associated protein Cas8c/Csd1 [Candidatus Wallbacteria bacterium]